MIYLIKPQDSLVESKTLSFYKIEEKEELTQEQADLFYYNPLPEGKRRKAGTLELEDTPLPTTEEIAESNRIKAKTIRDNAVSENITVYDAEWQVANDAEDIRKVIGDAETIDASEEDSVTFRLADNSWRETTLAELRDVLKAHIARKQDVWNQMAVWDFGDKQEPFEVK